MMSTEYIAERRKATKRLNAKIRAMPEFAVAVTEMEACCRTQTERLAYAQVFNQARGIVNGRK